MFRFAAFVMNVVITTTAFAVTIDDFSVGATTLTVDWKNLDRIGFSLRDASPGHDLTLDRIITVIPEPSTLAMSLLGWIGLLVIRRRRRGV